MKALLFSALLICIAFISKGQTNKDINEINEDGKHVVYYQNGNVKAQGNFKNSKREGEWIFFYESGTVALKKNFSNGEQVGEWTYYNQDGTLAMKVDDITKIDEKVEMTRYEKNKVKTKSTFVDGKKQEELNNKF